MDMGELCGFVVTLLWRPPALGEGINKWLC